MKEEVKAPFISVIIPTYHDWERLQLCLNALQRQTYSHDRFEIIVVNNDPSDLVPKNLLLPENCILIQEAKPGSYSARNKAISIAKGEVVAFTDSDCIPDINWLSSAVNVLEKNSKFSRVGGKIEFLKGSVGELAYYYEMALGLDQKTYVDKRKSAVTANMITRKDVFDQIGLFNDGLMSGGDIEWGERANRAGISIVYAPFAKVFHPARDTQEIKNKAKRTIGGVFNIHKAKGRAAVLKMLVITATPPFNSMLRVAKNKKIPLKFRVKVCFLRLYVRYLSLAELLLLFTGRSARRS